MSFLSANRWAASLTFRAIRQNANLFIMATGMASMALTIPLFLGTLTWSVSSPLLNVPIHTELTVFMDKNTGQEAAAKLTERIKEDSAVAGVRLMRKDEALAMVNKSLGLNNKRSEKINPLPDLLIVSVASTITAEEVQGLSDRIEKMKSVDNVAYDHQWSRYQSSLTTVLVVISSILSTAVGLLVLLVVCSSVRLTTGAQIEEIRALFIFCASESFIKSPYTYRGLLTMLFATLLSLGFTWLAVSLLAPPLAELASLYGVTIALGMPPVEYCIAYVAVASILGAVMGSYATNDILRQISRR